MNDDYSEGWLNQYESRTQYYSEAANVYRKNQEPPEPVEIDLEETTESSNLFERVTPGYTPPPSPTEEGVRPEPTDDDMVGSIMDIIHPQRDRDADFMEGVSGFVKDVARPLMESPVARGVAGGVRDAAQGVLDLGQDMEGVAHLGYISYGPEGFGYDKELPEGIEPIRLPDFDDNGIIKPVPLETGLNDEEMLQLQNEAETAWTEVLPGLSRDQYAELAAEAPGIDLGAAKESDLQGLRERIQEAGEAPAEAMRGLWGEKLADAPRRLRQAVDSSVAVSGVPSKAPQRGGVEGIVRGLTQFMTVFAGAGGMKQGASFLRQLSAGGIADASFDPELGNLSTFLRELDVDNELTQYLDSKVGEDATDEERLAARAKQALEGAGLAMIVPPLIGALKWAKAQNYGKQLKQLLDKGSEISTGGAVKEMSVEAKIKPDDLPEMLKRQSDAGGDVIKTDEIPESLKRQSALEVDPEFKSKPSEPDPDVFSMEQKPRKRDDKGRFTK